MSGQPAARIGDSVVKGKIITGSATVLIGDATGGMADSPCKGKPAKGGPVNPILGIKILPGETDFALPAPRPFVFARSYASDDARIGPLGPGWSIPGAGLGIESTAEALTLIDQQGRRIAFEPLTPGQQTDSASETLWLRRGGPIAPQIDAYRPWSGRWAGIPAELQHDPGALFVQSGTSTYHFVRRHHRWRLIAQFDRNGYRTVFNWAPEGELRSVIDSAGRCYRFVYQDHSTPSETDRGLRLAGIALDGQSPFDPFDPTDPATRWLVRYRYDPAGRLIEVLDRAGRSVRRFEWEDHLLAAHHDLAGRAVRYRWARSGTTARVIEQSEPDGLTRRYSYAAGVTEVTDNLGRIERYHHQGEGGLRRWTALERADGSRIEFKYDWAGRQVAQIDPLGRQRRNARDGAGHITAQIGPDGGRTEYQLDEFGAPLLITDPERRTLRIERDARGNPVAETGPDGASTRYAYANPRLPDRPTEITDARGGIKRLDWSAFGQLIAYTDCSGNTTRYAYDEDGRLISLTDALGQTWHGRYDTHGRLIEERGPDGATTGYAWDSADRLIARTDAGGNTSHLHYDEHGRLSDVTDPAGHRRRLAYDGAGRIHTLINDNGAATRFAWDALDRLIEERGIDERTRRYRYNGADELIGIEEASAGQTRTTRLERDAAGRLITRHLPATEHAPAQSERLIYNRAGQLTEAHNANCTVRWQYDNAGRLRNETQQHADGWRWQLAHQRNRAGLIDATHYGEAPPVGWLTYGPGHLHGLTIGGQQLDFERDSLHRERRRASAHWQALRDYDGAGRLAAWQLDATGPGTTPAWLRQYQYDPGGRPIRIEDSNSGAIGYTFDPSGRLIGSRHGQTEHHYAFDPAGNRLGSAHAGPPGQGGNWAAEVRARLPDSNFNALRGHGNQPAGPASPCWPDNRVLELDGTRAAYDAFGNLIERIGADGARMELGYDGADRLITLWRREANGHITEARYVYDALGRRIGKEVTEADGSSTTRFGWEGDRQVMEDIDGQLTRTTIYEPGSFVPLARIEMRPGGRDADAHADPGQAEAQAMLSQLKHTLLGAGLALPRQLTEAIDAQGRPAARIGWFHTDHLGTPLALTGEQGELLWYASPDDWGAIAEAHGSVTQPIRFQGQYHDAESGLYYNRHRYYDPGMGRYTSQDPIGLAGGMNFYDYVNGNSLSMVDPYGLWGAADLPSIPQPALDFATGVADAASLGIGPLARQALGVDGGVNRCSKAYSAGEWASLALGAGRMAYAGIAKVGAAATTDGAAAMAFRNGLKRVMRGPLAGSNFRIKNYEDLLAKYGSDEAIQAAAGRTNSAVNAVGADLATGGAVGAATCGCP